MSKQEVIEAIEKLMKDYYENLSTPVHLGSISEDTIINNVVTDSLDMVMIVMEVEKHFNIQIFDSEREDLETIGDLAGLIQKKL